MCFKTIVNRLKIASPCTIVRKKNPRGCGRGPTAAHNLIRGPPSRLALPGTETPDSDVELFFVSIES